MTGLAIMLLVGLAVGWTAGRRYQRAARGWRDYRARKAELPLLRAAAIAFTRHAALVMVLGAVLAGFALYVLAAGARH